MSDESPPTGSSRRTALLMSGAILAAAVVLVALSLRREAPVTFAPTAFGARPVGDSLVGDSLVGDSLVGDSLVGDSLVGPVRVTLDASDPERWVYFAFSRGAPVAGARDAWDLAFRRFNVRVNGGEGSGGRTGVVDLGDVPFDSVRTVPAVGYGDSLPRWYDYGFTSHLLTPKSRVYAIRTADGRYAKLRFLSYYCPGAQPGCVTVEYAYQGSGGREVARP